MIGEYRVSRCTRHCHSLNRPLAEGEWFYSVVLESDDDFLRQDFSAESWQGPPEGTVGWWKSRMPRADEKKLVLAPTEVLIDLLRQMEAFTEKAKTRYLLALMLMRKRLVRPCEKTKDDEGDEAKSDKEVMRIEVLADGSTMDVTITEITRSESESLREELNELLYCECEAVADDEDENLG
ncbi:hypothetical protein CA13_46950 [Planctomycetes bacterium CA13]|uniref:Uncharacterized protein n=1 Tax=Novipirellula herctigrandis TaxID=2527986 RepID=A0A5C5Z7Q2_9BACT|nr:hypothetical protein CA13_46950 [Planctomycetes bacterium CA13]